MPVESMYCCVALIIICIYLVIGERRRNRQAELVKRGIKICGKVRHVKREWSGRSLTRQYEVYAEFEFDGKTYYALEKYWHKPGYQAGDPIGICFDPADPDKNMLLDFSESDVNP